MIDARDFLDAVAGYANAPTNGPQSSANRPVKLGVIDPFYTSGPARVLFDGETVISSRGYSWVSGYTPVSGDRVYLIPVGQTYLIGGTLKSDVTYCQYHDIDLNELGGWTVYSSAFHNPSFTKTVSGVVKLSGLVANTNTGAIANNLIIGYLPEGFRPVQDMDFPAMTGSGNVVGAIQVKSDGKIVTRLNIQGVWASLGNIVFPTEDFSWNTPTLINGWTTGGVQGWTHTLQYGKDSLGRSWTRGSFGDPTPATPPAGDTVVFNLPSGYRPGPQGVYTVGASIFGTGGGFSHYYFNPTTGDVQWRVGSAYNSEVSVDGVVIPPTNADWIPMTFNNAWVSYGANNVPGYFKDSDGLVHLRGLAKTGAINTSITTLPVGYRPAKNIIRNTPSNSASSRVDIRSDGTVVPVTGSSLWVSLDSMVFTAEQ